MTKDQIVEILKTGIHTVTFTKVDGTERTMPCTLDPTIIPTVPVTESKQDRKVNDAVMRVYVTDINEWRSFRVDNLIQIV